MDRNIIATEDQIIREKEIVNKSRARKVKERGQLENRNKTPLQDLPLSG